MLIFSILLVSIVSAKSSDLFIDHLTKTIQKDCNGKDIIIKEGFYFREPNNESVTLIEWSDDNYHLIRYILESFSNSEPYNQYFGGCGSKGNAFTMSLNGCEILACDNHKLDINGYDYFWDEVRVDVPREEFKTTYGHNSPIVETYGDKSPVTTGDNSPITQQERNIWIDLFLSKGTIAGAIIGFLLKILYDIIKQKLFSKKRKKKSSK